MLLGVNNPECDFKPYYKKPLCVSGNGTAIYVFAGGKSKYRFVTVSKKTRHRTVVATDGRKSGLFDACLTIKDGNVINIIAFKKAG